MEYCGTCKKECKDRDEYLKHKCEVTGFKPDTVDHLNATSNGKFSQQSAKAIERGNAKKTK